MRNLSAKKALQKNRVSPVIVYWTSALAIYGWFFSYNFPDPISLGFTFKDIWQYLSALQALLESPTGPANPFVATDESSRLFTPLYALAGFVGHWLGWSQVDAYLFSSFINLSLMAAGIYIFGRAFFATTWGPAALLATTAFGTWVPFPHTGGHSPAGLIEGAGYPAVTAYGMGLLLWGMGIKVLDGARSHALDAAIVAIIALLVPQHQMGAGIALIGLTAFGVAWPSTVLKRFYLGFLTAVGLILAALWPYFDPYAILLTANRPEWNSGKDFYSAEVLAMLFLPIIVGLYWLRRPLTDGAHLPIILAACGYLGLYGLGALGSPVAHRMILPVVLLLEILLAVGLIRILSTGMTRWKMWTFSIWAGVSVTLLLTYTSMLEERGRKHNYLNHAAKLVSDLPSDAIIAGHFLTAGPFNAIGRKTLSSPMTEPLVEDMPQRRALNEKLFDPTISREERRFLMREAGVSALVVDEVWIDRETLDALLATTSRSRRSGPLIRLDP